LWSSSVRSNMKSIPFRVCAARYPWGRRRGRREGTTSSVTV
jgi:hypothetical protein